MTTVNIERRHWLAGIKRHPSRCAVGLAIQEAIGHLDELFIGHGIVIGIEQAGILSAELSKAIIAWDLYGTIPDETFTIAVEPPAPTLEDELAAILEATTTTAPAETIEV